MAFSLIAVKPKSPPALITPQAEPRELKPHDMILFGACPNSAKHQISKNTLCIPKQLQAHCSQVQWK